MITVRKATERGFADHGWLQTYHTFSFASYYDPSHRGFRSLRVINEDHVAPGRGFGTHSHDNMEIVTYVLEGALEHKDSMGNGEVLQAGEFQRMSAGTGITHSEFNPSDTAPVHLYQIWLLPGQTGLEPGYEQKRFEDAELRNSLRLVASPTGDRGSLSINQDACILIGRLGAGEVAEYPLADDRFAWLQVLRGNVVVNGAHLHKSDGGAISKESTLRLEATSASEVMLFDLV